MSDIFENLKSDEQQYFLRTYKRLNVHIAKGEGCYLITDDGRRILDMFGGLAVNILGYNHPAVNDAIINQIHKYIHISNLFYQDTQINLAEKLLKFAGFNKLFFTNSGTEAAETALKIIRKYFNGSDKKEIIAFEGSFHGRTLGALSITGRDKYRKDFEPLLADVKFVKINSAGELTKNVNDKIAAVFIECIQGEGGINPVSHDFISTLQKLRGKYGFLIIADEIQSGMGRTGKFLCFKHFGLKPDIVLLAKGMGGGLPLGAVLGNERIADIFDHGNHGSTFGGNPVSCAAGLTVMNELEKGLMENAGKVGAYLKEKLLVFKNEFPDKIKDVRGIGLMLGIELAYSCQPVVEKLLDADVLVNCTNDNVVRLLPPLIISQNEADIFLDKFRKVIQGLS